MGVNDSATQLEAAIPATESQPRPSVGRAWYCVTLLGMTVLTLFGSVQVVGLLTQSIGAISHSPTHRSASSSALRLP